MTNLNPHRDALVERVDVALKLVEETHGAISSTIAREARGLAVLMLFAAYENLLTSLTRTLLEAAVSLGVSNRRLQPGFRAFALEASAKSLRDLSQKKLYSHGLPKLVEQAASGSRVCSIDTNAFPDDGSYMKTTQIVLWCTTFDVTRPVLLLPRIWNNIDAVVSERNGIAHGRLTPDEVGRRYTEPEIRDLIEDWRLDWLNFLAAVEARARSRDFFRVPR